ncbi:hypothetical protein PTKIN_Ptkin04bG0035200 [Pterospermum kingtungense]
MEHEQEIRGRALPKFGEWDVNNADEGFTVIFNKARHEKKTRGSSAGSITTVPPPPSTRTTSSRKTTTTTSEEIENEPTTDPPCPSPSKSKWLCCVRV